MRKTGVSGNPVLSVNPVGHVSLPIGVDAWSLSAHGKDYQECRARFDRLGNLVLAIFL